MTDFHYTISMYLSNLLKVVPQELTSITKISIFIARPSITKQLQHADTVRWRSRDVTINKGKVYDRKNVNLIIRLGTHWTYDILYMLQNGKAEYSTSGIQHIDFYSAETNDAVDSPRVLVSHCYPQNIPKFVAEGQCTCKVIYVYRNPKDTAVSMHSFLKQLDVEGIRGYQGKWEHFFELLTTKPLYYNTWFEHVKAWLDFKKKNSDVPVLMMPFEEMKKDLRSCVQKMAEFLGTKQDPDFLDDVTNKCQFSAMSKAKTTNTKEIAMSKDGSNPFYRKGDVGDWKNWFTVAQDEMFDALIEQNMTDIDLEVKYTL